MNLVMKLNSYDHTNIDDFATYLRILNGLPSSYDTLVTHLNPQTILMMAMFCIWIRNYNNNSNPSTKGTPTNKKTKLVTGIHANTRITILLKNVVTGKENWEFHMNTTRRITITKMPKNTDTWILDSGADFYVVNNLKYYSDTAIITNINIQVANQCVSVVASTSYKVGTVKLRTNDQTLLLKNCCYMPSFKHNIISVSTHYLVILTFLTLIMEKLL
jgi:hypothetical protein